MLTGQLIKQKLGDRPLIAAFIISSLGHMAFLRMLGVDINLPSRPAPREVVVNIEIERPALLPEIETMGDAKKIKEELIKKEVVEETTDENLDAFKERPIVEVADPADEAMLRYQDMVKQRIEKTRRYPVWAKREGINGVVYINFTVLSDGTGRDVRVARSSGYKILDEEAVENIKRANPFPPIPETIDRPSIEMDVSIVYKLE